MIAVFSNATGALSRLVSGEVFSDFSSAVSGFPAAAPETIAVPSASFVPGELLSSAVPNSLLCVGFFVAMLAGFEILAAFARLLILHIKAQQDRRSKSESALISHRVEGEPANAFIAGI